MKRTIFLVAGLTVGALGISAGPANAWDCIRVSSSQQGLMQSTTSGNWEYLTLDDLIAGAAEEGIPDDVAQCVANEWRADGLPEYFAIGTGVAGARGAMQSGHITDSDFFELAKNAPLNVMTDGHGVDHLDDILNGYLAGCFGSGA